MREKSAARGRAPRKLPRRSLAAQHVRACVRIFLHSSFSNASFSIFSTNILIALSSFFFFFSGARAAHRKRPKSDAHSHACVCVCISSLAPTFFSRVVEQPVARVGFSPRERIRNSKFVLCCSPRLFGVFSRNNTTQRTRRTTTQLRIKKITETTRDTKKSTYNTKR